MYHIGLEKIEGSWRWTRDNTLVFDQNLWCAYEPNGQSLIQPELCGGFVSNVGTSSGMLGVADVSCSTLLHFICEL